MNSDQSRPGCKADKTEKSRLLLAIAGLAKGMDAKKGLKFQSQCTENKANGSD
jgi:hypothetical protein